MEDVYFVLFHRKWMILLCAAASILLGCAVYLKGGSEYLSEAKLLVRYVMDTGAPLPTGTGDRIRTPDSRGEAIINTEMEILSSVDLAGRVADSLGPDRIIDGADAEHPRAAAVHRVMRGLTIQAPRRSSVIKVAYSHRDPAVAQQVLQELITQYLARHAEIHHSSDGYDYLSRQTVVLGGRLRESEAELRRLKNEAGVISLEESKQALANELGSLRGTLFETGLELARREALFNIDLTTPLATTNSLPEEAHRMPEGPSQGPLSSSMELMYQALLGRLKGLRERELDYASRFTPENTLRKRLQEQIAEAEGQKTRMEMDYPGLMRSSLAARLDPASPDVPSDSMTEAAQISALKVQLGVLTNHLAKVRAEALVLETYEQNIIQRQREKDLLETTYKYFATSLEQARIDDSLDPRKMANISLVQAPSPPAPASAGRMKIAVGLVFLGVGGGLGLAFLLELFLDPRVKRPSEIERSMQLPFLLSIPRSRGTGLSSTPRRRLGKLKPKGGRSNPADATGPGPTEQTSELPALPENRTQPQIAPWDVHHALRSYYEALTDRLIGYFERMNMTHKPKLVGVVGCHAGAGVSTIAAGLAGTLSETGGGAVLLVDLTGEQGSAHPFFQGKPGCPLFDALETDKRDAGVLQDRLYHASLGTLNGEPHPVRTRAFDTWMPKLRTSDYDYVVFDLPPMVSTSIVYRLAKHLDHLLVVAEADKTNRHAVKRAIASLQESNAHVSTVLNKHTNRLPAWATSIN